MPVACRLLVSTNQYPRTPAFRSVSEVGVGVTRTTYVRKPSTQLHQSAWSSTRGSGTSTIEFLGLFFRIAQTRIHWT